MVVITDGERLLSPHRDQEAQAGGQIAVLGNSAKRMVFLLCFPNNVAAPCMFFFGWEPRGGGRSSTSGSYC